MTLKDIIESKFENILNKPTISTGFKDLDYLVGESFNSANVLTLSGVSGVGKTTFAMNISFNMASNTDKDIVFFSFQKKDEQLLTKIFSHENMVTVKDINNKCLNSDDWIKISKSVEKLYNISNYHIIDNVDNIVIDNMKKTLQEYRNLGLVVIDNLQIMATGLNVAEVLRNIKLISQELNVPILVISQLSPISNKRLTVSDLKPIDGIDIYSDVIIFIYDEEYYYKDMSKFKRLRQYVVCKNNNGVSGDFELEYSKEFNGFKDINKENIERFDKHGIAMY